MVDPRRQRPVHHPGRVRRPLLALGVLAVAHLLGGCATMSPAELAAQRMEGELVRLRAQNAALSGRVDALELRSEGFKAAALAVRKAEEELAPRGEDRPELEVVRLMPSGSPKAKATPLDDAPEPRRDAGERARLAASEFARAEGLLAAKKYEAALDAFAGFVVRFPEHPRATEATLRRGECYLRAGQHARAAEHLQAAISADPSAPTAGDALALLARAHDGAGDREAARRDRERLRKEFPEHPAAMKLETREGSR
jgi:TolA-binding protein